MAQYAWAKGWKSAALATDTVIVYFKDVVKAFKARFTQLGGKIVARGELPVARRQHDVQQNVVTPPERQEGRRDRDLDRPAFGAMLADPRLGPPLARQRHADAQLVGR